jgi:hypothetical protein
MVPLLQSGAITTVETEVIVALVSAATMVAALWVRWRARHVTGDAGTA